MLTYLYELDYIDGEAWSTPPEESGKSSSTSSPRLPIIHPSTVTEHPPYADQEDVDAQLVLSLDDKERLASIHERMMNNVMVYAIADKYDIPELKDLAKEKFHGQIEEVWPHEDLSSVVKAVYQTTPTGDMGLRQIIIDACSAHFEDIVKDEAIMETLMETADLATGLLVKSVQHLTLAKAQQELVQLKLGTSLEQVGRWPSCRHCAAEFNTTVELCSPRLPGRYGSDTTVQMRCKKCRTRHNI